MNNESKLLMKIKMIPSLILISFSIAITLLIIEHNETHLENQNKYIKDLFIKKHKDIIKNEVNKIHKMISFEFDQQKKILLKLNEQEIKSNILMMIESLEYDKQGYIFIIDYEGNMLINIKKSLTNENQIRLKDKNGFLITQEIIKVSKKGEGYLSYIGIDNTHHTQSKKISFIKEFKPWNWAIGYGFHPYDIQHDIDINTKNLYIQNNIYVKKILTINILLTMILTFLLIMYSKNINKIFKSYKKNIKKKAKINRQKDEIISHQSKMATMGELINLISHQWRQPLTQINALTLNIYLLSKQKQLDDITLKHNIRNIENTTEYLSNTIDDFSEFFLEDKNKKLFLSNDALQGCLKIIEPSIDHIDIDIKTTNEKKIMGYKTLYQQVILTILTNSLDIFKSKNIKNPKININLYDHNNYSVLEIYDNAGGIDQKNIKKVFDLYFSTKSKKSTSGLGLYIAKKIITRNMNGIIDVYNYKNGAKFIIKVRYE